ncbi:acyl-CoA dehydrogenase [Chloropicon primus]|uniref:Acyl-CoA dehydrogenase n=1 Tax=Chloropicon primus TaxID=1764295 RepID=A0A5B8MKI5_9CHLO|nr:acyl-CoA dehydrogenase [Chloropicon primus]UPR00197.1 acyl-CoA dehydrogenase [Chloropicon primus]|eukprot:QDZ20986.1 acyl-CoA dehydrogenase [Chloropicon primus]
MREDLEELGRFMVEAEVEGYGEEEGRRGRLVARKYPNGQSNPTYLVECVDREDGRVRGKWVLRRKPDGKLLPSAHAVDREFAFQRALRASNVPVATVHAYCEDARVVGSSFYLMEHCEGEIWKDPRLPNCSPPRRERIYHELARSLARLHSVDASRLPDVPKSTSRGGRPRASYGLRTLRRWKMQYLASCAAVREDPLKNMMFLAKYLQDRAPNLAADDREIILHGDFRLDNIICDRRTDEVRAILDWELATVGTRDQALADVAYCCLPYYLPPTVLAIQTLTKFCKESGDLVLDRPQGVPSLEEFLSTYNAHLEAGGARVDGLVESHQWRWFVCLALFRVAAILAGVGSRAKAGNASAKNASVVGSRKVVSGVIDTAIALIELGDVGEDDGLRFELLKHRARIFCKKVHAIEDVLVEHESSSERWTPHPVVEKLKVAARGTGLWNCFLSKDLVQEARKKLEAGGLVLTEENWFQLLGPGLSNRKYMEIAEIMGKYPFSIEVFNCNAPDTGNMEVLIRHGTPDQCREWLLPLLRGEIRSCFAMTEPNVASSDATNVSATVERRGGEVVVNGLKWWITGAMHPRCKICLFLGKEKRAGAGKRSSHSQHTIVLLPMSSPGLKVVKPLDVMGFEDPPYGHAEVSFRDVTVPSANIIHKPGKGFEVAQSRLGPGRLHHCARAIGIAERALEIALERARKRVVFGSPIATKGGFLNDLAQVRLGVDQARLLVEAAASILDKGEEEGANPTSLRYVRMALAQAKVVAPKVCLEAIDFAMQVHGAAGMSSKITILPQLWSHARTLRIADGPDAVHLSTISKLEIKTQRAKL